MKIVATLENGRKLLEVGTDELGLLDKAMEILTGIRDLAVKLPVPSILRPSSLFDLTGTGTPSRKSEISNLKSSSPRKSPLRDAIVEVLKLAGKPIAAADIVTGLKRFTDTKVSKGSVQTTLSAGRKTHFTSPKRGLWTLAGSVASASGVPISKPDRRALIKALAEKDPLEEAERKHSAIAAEEN